MSIKRYDLQWEDYETCYMEEFQHGDYVLYEDFQKIVNKLQEEAEEQEIRIKYLEDKYT